VAEKAYITPKILSWARDSARMPLDVAASKIGKPIEILEEWESGVSQPTIKQAEKLAKIYKRPFALFFLPEIPKDFHPLQDFRKSDSIKLTTGSIFIIREIQQKQAWLSDVLQENGEEKLPFIGKYSINDSPEKVAKDILSTLNINTNNYTETNPIKEWVNKAELSGIYISRTSFIHSRLTLDKNEVQGFAIADPYAPFVFVNSKDWAAPQLFTLIHEIAHLWISETGISNEIEFEQTKSKAHPVEIFSNEVAANILMPKELIFSLDSKTFDNSKEVFNTAKLLGVSSFALLFRAFTLTIIDVEKYKSLKNQATIDFNAFLKREELKKEKQKKQKGGPNPYLLKLNKNSRLFTQFVLDGFKNGFVEPTQASFLLNTPINKFNKLESQLYK
jgi:Zn-dependent peptidase ImmA (M78 family)/transcriptional regulator with XRE-family HTH domain